MQKYHELRRERLIDIKTIVTNFEYLNHTFYEDG